MILALQELPSTLRGPAGDVYRGRVPKRMLFLNPVAAASLLLLERDTGGLIYSDILRSAESSLSARRTKRGVQRPGYSGHNYGLSVDLDLDGILASGKLRYTDILVVMAAHDWHCHRRDGRGPHESEAWHFNYLGPRSSDYLSHADVRSPATWSLPVETRILELHANDFVMGPTRVQTLLQKLRFYSGELDGDMGPLSREAISAFQRAWDLPDDGVAGPQTQRTLAFVSAERRVAPLVG